MLKEEENSDQNIQFECTGGGKIEIISNEECEIFGFSYLFGMADHLITKNLIEFENKKFKKVFVNDRR